MKNIALITVIIILALVAFLTFRGGSDTPRKQKTEDLSPPVAPPTTALSLLADSPDWPALEAYQHTITRTDFEHLLTQIFTTDETWRQYITIHDTSVEILTTSDPVDPPFTLHFATSENTLPAPRHWKTTATLPQPPPGKPLTGLHIAIDPGHIGGEWAKIEERWFQIGDAKPVEEGTMTLQVAKLLKPLLEDLGAEISLVRTTTEPVTPLRPATLTSYAEGLSLPGSTDIKKFTEKLFYRTAEIRARADLVNNTIKPDLVLCLHFNAAGWGDPDEPTLIPQHHFHILLNGAYTPDEVHLADQRFALLEKLLQRTHSEEVLVGKTVAKTFAEISNLPPYTYPPGGTNYRTIPTSSFLYARNLLANRLYDCPVIFMEPYVMNSTPDYNRIQLGDYEGLKEVNAQQLPSIFQEYANALAQGLAKHYSKN